MEMCDLGENSPPFVSMPLAAMRKVVDYLSGEQERTSRDSIGVLSPTRRFFRRLCAPPFYDCPWYSSARHMSNGKEMGQIEQCFKRF